MNRFLRLASGVLHTFGVDAALIGDLEEAFRGGRSRFWYSRQVVGLVLFGSLPPFVIGWLTLLIALLLFHMAVAGPLWIAARETGRGLASQVAWSSAGYIPFALAAWFVSRFHRKAAAARKIRQSAQVILLIVIAAIIMELCAVAVVVFAATAPAPQRQAEWSDPSPHEARLVTVEDDVRLEVLDWGGSGPALVLLAGLGDTAHVFDDVAPMLATRYRVVGVTRRGHRGSSAATGGYGFARLADDVIRVVDAMGINNPVIIGHSFAGEELHVLGSRYAARIRGLVYVDGAFDRGDDADSQTFNTAARKVPTAPTPTAGDLVSFAALRAYLQKYSGGDPEMSLPEGYLRTRYRTNADGTVGGLWAPDPPVRQAMASAIQAAYKPYRPERIRVPALAIYAVPKSADDLIRRGSSNRLAFPELITRAADDAALREGVERLYLLTRARVRNHERWFETLADRARVVELSGTHHLVISNPREVLTQIDAFVSSLPNP